MRVVLKYGGSSVATLEKISKIADYIKELKEKIDEIIIVVSAMGKTTDELLKKAYSLAGTPNKRGVNRSWILVKTVPVIYSSCIQLHSEVFAF